MLNNKKLSQGRSMVEMLGVLGIMALITALGIIAYNQATQMFKMDKLKNEVNKIKISLAANIISLKKIEGVGKVKIENYLQAAGIKKTNTTPLGGKTYYDFWEGQQPVFSIVIMGLETLEECNELSLHFPAIDEKLVPNYCKRDPDGTYGLRIIFPKH